MADKYSIKLMPRALRDLDGIYSYFAKKISETDIALKLVENIENEIFTLETMPHRCPERKIGAYAHKGYRQLLVKNYIVIFRVDENNKSVIIVTIRYSLSQF